MKYIGIGIGIGIGMMWVAVAIAVVGVAMATGDAQIAANIAISGFFCAFLASLILG
jgi:hypothetical protein